MKKQSGFTLIELMIV
ncbi:MAG: prepilin-type N-terminal cleavage/methylation domain-containing protein, partial [Aeromonas sp.]